MECRTAGFDQKSLTRSNFEPEDDGSRVRPVPQLCNIDVLLVRFVWSFGYNVIGVESQLALLKIVSLQSSKPPFSYTPELCLAVTVSRTVRLFPVGVSSSEVVKI